MENDDDPVGRILSRREVLKLLGAVSAAVLVGCGTGQEEAAVVATPAATAASGVLPACVVRPEMTEGPYFVDDQLNRSDIRTEPSDGAMKAGVPLALLVNVSQIGSNGCVPLAGAVVDVWHCDAEGMYSGVSDQGFNTEGQKFLRGYQVTNDKGVAQFLTIYPGWYSGRTVHIHFKIRTETADQQSYEFTSQWFFDETVTDQVYTQTPYSDKGQRSDSNATDGIYQNGGDQLLLTPVQSSEGYAATFDIGLDLSS